MQPESEGSEFSADASDGSEEVVKSWIWRRKARSNRAVIAALVLAELGVYLLLDAGFTFGVILPMVALPLVAGAAYTRRQVMLEAFRSRMFTRIPLLASVAGRPRGSHVRLRGTVSASRTLQGSRIGAGTVLAYRYGRTADGSWFAELRTRPFSVVTAGGEHFAVRTGHIDLLDRAHPSPEEFEGDESTIGASLQRSPTRLMVLAEDGLRVGEEVELAGTLEWASTHEDGTTPSGRDRLAPWIIGCSRAPVLLRRLAAR